MPKQFGRCTRCTLVVASLLALNFAGCRTATSRLASIPGMGWIDRSEKSFGEGWADYEPAPELPPPSATSEPSATSSTSGLASNLSGSNSQQSYGAYSDTGKTSNSDGTGQFFGSSADAESQRYNTSSTYGNYALGGSNSSYGAAGSSPDTSYSSGSNTSTPQQGFYGGETPPNYATSTPSAYGSYEKPTSSPPGGDTGAASRYGDYAAGGGSRYGSDIALSGGSLNSPTYGGSPSATAYTADRTSRFGASGFDGTTSRAGTWSSDTTGAPKTSSPNGTSTYTPPGFPAPSSYSTSSPPSNTGVASRFDTYQGATHSAADRVDQPRGGVRDSIGTAAPPTSSRAPGHTVNNHANLSGSSTRTGSPIQSAPGGSAPTGGGHVDTQRQPTNSMPASSQSDSVGRFHGGDRFGGAPQGIPTGTPLGSPSTSATTIDSPASNAGGYADVLMQATPNQLQGSGGGGTADAASGYIQAAQDGFGQPREAVKDYASASPVSGRNVMDQRGTPIPQYPSTSTPNSYLAPSTTSPTPTSATPSSSIRRSSTPWRPGSTSDFQGSNMTGQGSTIQTSYRPSLDMSMAALNVHDHLTLAVGDKFQFPRHLR